MTRIITPILFKLLIKLRRGRFIIISPKNRAPQIVDSCNSGLKNMKMTKNMDMFYIFPAEVFFGSRAEIFSGSPTEMFSGSATEVFFGSLTQMFPGSATEVFSGSPTETFFGSPNEIFS